MDQEFKDLNKVEQMIKLMRNYGVQELKIDDGGHKIKVAMAGPGQPVFNGVPAAQMMPQYVSEPSGVSTSAASVSSEAATVASEAVPKTTGFEVKSPFVGTYYAAPAPGEDPFVQVGQRVNKGDTLCIVEAMKLMNEIEAERSGVIKEIRIENEQPVEFDQVIFIIE